jgi:hypothetical protein
VKAWGYVGNLGRSALGMREGVLSIVSTTMPTVHPLVEQIEGCFFPNFNNSLLICNRDIRILNSMYGTAE